MPTPRIRKLFVPSNYRAPVVIGWQSGDGFTPDEGIELSPETPGEFMDLNDDDVATLPPPPMTRKDIE